MTNHILAACFLLCCCSGIGIQSTEVDDIMELLQKKIHELASTNELKQKVLHRITIARDCSLAYDEVGVALLRKMIMPIVSGATPCASMKSGIPDPVERDQAEKQCFKEMAFQTKASVGLTPEEDATFKEVSACIFSRLPVVNS
ncbi:hypothetical protein MRX96_058932 [Rhipicephalus microplus]